MLMEFSKVYLPPEVHEIIGICLIVLVIIHLILNRRYIKAIPKGKYNLKRAIMLVINVAFMVVFALTCIFGLLSGQYVLTFMNIGNLTTVYLHKILAYLSLLLLGLHLGINLNVLFERIEKSNIVYAVYLIIVAFGIYSIIQLDFLNHLLGNSGFSLVTGNFVINSIEYLSIIMMVTILTNIIFKKVIR